MTKIIFRSGELNLGCDPELFLKKGRSVIGSEKIIPEKPVGYDNYKHDPRYRDYRIRTGDGAVIRDGIQVELNPDSSFCREIHATNIYDSIVALSNLADASGVEIDMRVNVPITKKEMKSLSPSSKQFGCSPSYNVYPDEANRERITDASKFFERSAGGHIHLGDNDHRIITPAVTFGYKSALKGSKRELTVKVLDLICGNTCVMIDRDEGNIARRKNYGRAGEYRMPEYGIEYRTPSNFWLHSYTLMSMVMALARQAVAIVAYSSNSKNYAEELLALVPEKDIRDAINNNDADLAKKNFDKIKQYVVDNFESSYTPFTEHLLPEFEYFLSKSIKYWKLDNIKNEWLVKYSSGRVGIENFLVRNVQTEMKRKKLIK